MTLRTSSSDAPTASTSPDDRCRVCGSGLYLDDVTEPTAPLWLDADGEYATCRDGDPHIPLRW